MQKESGGAAHTTRADSTPVFTVNHMLSAGTVFQAMRDELKRCNDRKWVDVTVDTATRKGNAPCCSRIEGVNLFLGDKSTSEAMIEDARLVSMRVRRVSSASTDGPACVHKKRRLSRPAEKQSSLPFVSIVNYFAGLKCITLKAKMVATLCNAYGARQVFHDVTPQTFILYPRKAVCDERHHWQQALARGDSAMPDNMWVIKSSHGCKGTGICLLNAGNAHTRREATDIILDHIDSQPAVHPWVAQRYVARPLLIRGRKFDMRAWVLVAHDLRVYLYKDGVCRMSSELYDATDLSNRLIHLTNHCLQADGPNYGKFEKGNELPFDAIDAELADRKTKSGRPMSFREHIRPQLISIVGTTLRAARDTIVSDPYSSVRSFQLLGYDFIIDDGLKLWLIEVNGSPGVADHLLSGMARDVIDVAVNPILNEARGAAGAHPSPTGGFEQIDCLL